MFYDFSNVYEILSDFLILLKMPGLKDYEENPNL